MSSSGFPGGSVMKNPPASAGNKGLIPEKENGNPLQYSCLGNPMDRGAWQTTVYGIAKVRHDLATEHKHSHNVQFIEEAIKCIY